MPKPERTNELCEKCHEREITMSAFFPIGGKLVFRKLCQVCFDAESAQQPRSLQGLLDQLDDAGPKGQP